MVFAIRRALSVLKSSKNQPDSYRSRVLTTHFHLNILERIRTEFVERAIRYGTAQCSMYIVRMHNAILRSRAKHIFNRVVRISVVKRHVYHYSLLLCNQKLCAPVNVCYIYACSALFRLYFTNFTQITLANLTDEVQTYLYIELYAIPIIPIYLHTSY